ncbi:Hsp20/alpha crystallin family protein [Geoalkalibacter sp.]|uniref:Hsp20/alpha crystallin family protein n=1 Tax=Geoalkalibacter sp. TaxID=3041440 RepID=UPI00272E7B3C|nr:Hsp20/alpha crystallin family protein [Geoalkalibacter sp.]
MARWDLFREMDMLRREVDEAFRSFGMGQLLGPAFIPGIGTGDYPRINLSEDNDAFYVEALVPGLEPQDIELSVMQGTLTLSGERKEGATNQRTWHRRERGTGKFLRTIELPAAVDSEKVGAEYRNGVLAITLPKAEAMKPKKISVRAN